MQIAHSQAQASGIPPKPTRSIAGRLGVTGLLLAVAFLVGVAAWPGTASAAPSDYWYAGGWALTSHAPSLNQYFNVARDPDGNVYVSDEYNYAVQKFDAGGHLLASWGAGTDPTTFNMPLGMASDSAGNVYVADEANWRIKRVSGSGTWDIPWIYGMWGYPADVACDGNGNVYVLVWRIMAGEADVYKYTAGVQVTTWNAVAPGGSSPYKYPRGIACDAFGHVYVADTDNNRIEKFDSAGTFLGMWSGDGPAAMNAPRGLACDSAGNIIVADTGNNRVTVFGPGGALITSFGRLGSGNGEFNAPADVACGPADALWVTDGNNFRLQRFAHDTTAPVTTATCQPAGWTKGNVTVTLSASDDVSGVGQTVFRIGDWASGLWDLYVSPIVVTTPGTTVSFRSTDVNGNGEAVKTLAVLIDRTGPTDTALAKASVIKGKKATFRFRVNDLTPTAAVTIKIYKGKKRVKTVTVGSKPTNSTQSYKWTCKLAKGSYTWKVYAKDLAGNVQVKVGSKALVVK